jgi:CHRD domain-containing protein
MKRVVAALAVVLWVSAVLPVQAQSRTFKTRLSPVPVPTFNPSIVGVGSVTATLSGNKLTIAGTFEGLATPATTARIHKSTKTGVRGDSILNLTITNGTSGSISGTFDLTPAQVQELAAGRYYVQVQSEKAPEGNLWGWLLAQETKK